MTTLAKTVLTTSSAPVSRPAGFLGSAVQAFRKWYRHRSDMRHVLELNDYLLRDVGLTRDQVTQAAGKPFWRG